MTQLPNQHRNGNAFNCDLSDKMKIRHLLQIYQLLGMVFICMYKYYNIDIFNRVFDESIWEVMSDFVAALFSIFQINKKNVTLLPIDCHVHTSEVSSQLKCGDIWQISVWFMHLTYTFGKSKCEVIHCCSNDRVINDVVLHWSSYIGCIVWGCCAIVNRMCDCPSDKGEKCHLHSPDSF